MTENTLFTSMPIPLARLSLVRITPWQRYHANTLVLSGIFIFQIFLLLSTGVLGWIKALYIESTEKFPLVPIFQRNSLGPCVSWTVARRYSKAFQDACLGPYKLHLNDTFGGNISNTLARVSLLCRTILYKAGNCSRRGALSSHLSSQNLISEPSLIEKNPYGEKISS